MAAKRPLRLVYNISVIPVMNINYFGDKIHFEYIAHLDLEEFLGVPSVPQERIVPL